MQDNTSAWHAILDDLIGYVQYQGETGQRVLPGSPALLAALAAPPSAAAQTPSPAPAAKLDHIPLAPPAPVVPKDDPQIRQKKFDALTAAINACTLCPLCKIRKRPVPGQGNIHAPDILFIDETPAPEDDATGLAASPGAHHDLLPKMIKAMGYSPDQVFITSLCKCFPATPRPPQESLDACRPYIDTLIDLLKPKVIVLLGAGATMGLLKKSAGTAVAKTRGAWTHYRNIPAMPTYAPGYINKFPAVKSQVWKDLQIVMKHLGKPLPPPKK